MHAFPSLRRLNLLRSLLISFAFVAGFFCFSVQAADAATYYFNNAVNTSPAELGNYWNDPGMTDPALGLPDFDVDEVTVTAGATFDGDAIFIDRAVNFGTVTGDATFIGDLSENSGTINGAAIRRFLEDATTTRSFLDEGPWLLIADGAVVNLNDSTIEAATMFEVENGGSFIYTTTLDSAFTFGNRLTLFYDRLLNEASVPDISDYSVSANDEPVAVTSVDVSGKRVTLILASTIETQGAMTVSYDPGLSPLQNIALQDIDALIDQPVSPGFIVEDAPVYSYTVGNKLYVSNNHSSSVSVINTITGVTLATITVGSYPEFYTLVGYKLYVTGRTSNQVTVIDTRTDTVTASIPVVADAYFSIGVGTKIYVSNVGSNVVSVIDTNTDTVIANVPVGGTPFCLNAIGDKIFVPVSSANSMKVIDTNTDTVVATIALGAGSRYVVGVGNKVYVNKMNNSVAVIDATTYAVLASIPVGTFPHYGGALGTKVYAPNIGSNTVSIIDTVTDTVLTTLAVGLQPYSVTILGNRVYINNSAGDTVSVIDALTDTVIETVAVGGAPFYSSASGLNIYTSNNTDGTISVINNNSLSSQAPNLTSFSTTIPSGTYSVGKVIPITATFSRQLLAGSTMTVRLSTGASVVLSAVSGKTLTGNYTVAANENTPDLAVTSISSASVSDTYSHTRTSYDIPFSAGNFVAENSLIARNIGDNKNIAIGNYLKINVGSSPYQISAPISVNGENFVYVANQGEATVSVIRAKDNVVVATIPVGSEAYGLATLVRSGVTYLYVANTNADTVSVINTATNSVIATVAVGVKPYYVATVGTKVYVTNGQSNTVSVIDANTNTVSATVSVGNYPRGIKAHGTEIYVANYGDPNYGGGNTVSVIDTLTDTVSETILLPGTASGPRGLTVAGTNVYTANYRSGNVSVIDTATNTVTATIAVGDGPRGLAVVGNNLYVENFDDSTISVVNMLTNTVTATVYIGHSPAGMGVSGTDIYFSRFQDSLVSIFDTLTNTVRLATRQSSGAGSGGLSSSGAEDPEVLAEPVAITPVPAVVTPGVAEPEVLSISDLKMYDLLRGSILLKVEDRGKAYYVHPSLMKLYYLGRPDDAFRVMRQQGVGIGNSDLMKIPVGLGILTGIDSDNDGLIDILEEAIGGNRLMADTDGDGYNDKLEIERGYRISGPHKSLFDMDFARRQSGKILLQVEDNGEAWYVNPADNMRYYLGRPNDAFEIMKAFGVGISNQDFDAMIR